MSEETIMMCSREDLHYTLGGVIIIQGAEWNLFRLYCLALFCCMMAFALSLPVRWLSAAAPTSHTDFTITTGI
jgi:hypothetical protein